MTNVRLYLKMADLAEAVVSSEDLTICAKLNPKLTQGDHHISIDLQHALC